MFDAIKMIDELFEEGTFAFSNRIVGLIDEDPMDEDLIDEDFLFLEE